MKCEQCEAYRTTYQSYKFANMKLREENKKLREALEKITTRKMSSYLTASHMNRDFIKIAQEALEGNEMNELIAKVEQWSKKKDWTKQNQASSS